MPRMPHYQIPFPPKDSMWQVSRGGDWLRLNKNTNRHLVWTDWGCRLSSVNWKSHNWGLPGGHILSDPSSFNPMYSCKNMKAIQWGEASSDFMTAFLGACSILAIGSSDYAPWGPLEGKSSWIITGTWKRPGFRVLRSKEPKPPHSYSLTLLL